MEQGAIQEPDGPYATSACRTCSRAVCTRELGACMADPGCAAFVRCLDRCGLAEGGDVEPGCADACVKDTSAAGEDLRKVLRACQEHTAQGACPSCGLIECEAVDLNPVCDQERPLSELSPCRRCGERRCCTHWAACQADERPDGCRALVKECLTDNPHDFCTNRKQNAEHRYLCQQRHQAGLARFGALMGCISVRCLEADSCYEDPCKPGQPAEAFACAQCVRDNCACLDASTDATPDFQMFMACLGAMACGNDPVCQQQCLTMHPGARKANSALLNCMAKSCRVPCGG